MKTILSCLFLIILVSCARRPSDFQDVDRTQRTGLPVAPAETPTPVPVTPAALEPSTPPTIAAAAGTNAVEPPDALGLTEPTPGLPAPTLTATPPTPVPAPVEQILPPGMIDFRNMPLEQVLDVYAELVGRTLLRPAALPAQQITLKTQTQLTKSEAIQALDAVLGMNGITMINVTDKFVKVATEPQANQMGAPRDQRLASQFPELGPYISHVVQLKYVKPSEIVPVLLPFAKLPNSILPIDSSQMLVLRDYTENVKRMLEMVVDVDVVVQSEFVSEVIPIKYAKATEIADALNSLSDSGGGGTTSIGRSTGHANRAGAAGGRPGLGGRPGVGGAQPGYGQPNNPMGGAQGGGAGTGAPGQNNLSQNLQRIIQRASSASGDLAIFGTMKMIADERSNSLLIFAGRADMETIKSVIKKLDVVLAQVLIETVIMDVQLDDSLAFGVSSGQVPKESGKFTGGGVFNNPGASGGNSPLGTLGSFLNNSLSNSAIFPSSSGLGYFGRYSGGVQVAIQAAASKSRVNIIQTPQILTSHATPGSIFIGNTVPYVTSTYYGGGFGGGPSSSYQQLSVGIGLSVTPYINPEGLVVMQVDETIDEISGSTSISGVGAVPNTTRRSLSAEVAVKDGDSVILGGFIRNSTDKRVSGVPLLENIPILGALFTSRSSAKTRKELVVLMRPTVLRTPEMAALTSTEERHRLPGISRAESEVLEQEKKELERERKRKAQEEKQSSRQRNQP